MSNLNVALDYFRSGLKVFPLFYMMKDGTCSCRPRNGACKRAGKHPIPRNGVQAAASATEADIIRWWTETPWANIGLATGHGGLVVVDIDDAGEKKGSESLAELERQFGKLPETRVIETGSGGRHFYFYSTEEISNSASKVGANIDIRGMGGYVILPPSNHSSGGRYKVLTDAKIADMPKWLESRCTGNRVDISRDTMDDNSPVVKDAKEGKEKISGSQLVRLLDFIPSDCDRDTWWQVGAALKKELGDRKGFEAWDAWSRKAADKYDEKVMPVQWASFQVDKGLTAGTIFHFAKTLGDFRGFDAEAADEEQFTGEWCFVASIKRFVNTASLVEWDREQFDAMHAPSFSRGKASEHVLKNPNFRRVFSATYWPEQETFVEEFGVSKLNYWKRNELEPEDGDCLPFEAHLEFMFPEGHELERKILLQYLAYQVQFPGRKVHWAVLIEGEQGNGKSYFARVMRTVLGASNVRMVSNEELHETYTGWQRNTQFIVVEEMMARGRLELMNKLKPMITENWCSIREMYRPPYEQPNRFNFLFFSNHRDSLILDATDRRYCILKSDAKPHPEGNRYYGPLFDWTRRNGGRLLAYLRRVDLSDFLPMAHAPMTAGKRELIEESLQPLDAYIKEQVDGMEYPFGWDLHAPGYLVEPLGKMGLRVNPKLVAGAFARLGYRRLGRMSGETLGRTVLWSVRNHSDYEQMSISQLMAIWRNQLADRPDKASEETIDALAKLKPNNPVKKNEPM